MPAWPGSVPYDPLVDTLEIAPDDVVARFQADAGTPISRKRYTAESRRYEFELIVTAAQLSTLDDFYRDDCGFGSLPFTLTDPEDGASRTFYWAAPFTRRPVSRDDHWRIRVSLVREAL